MNNHNIENFMKLATNQKDKLHKESSSDQYYRKMYERLENGKIISLNLAAMFGINLWLIYRKMYMTAFLTSIFYFSYLVVVEFLAINLLSGWCEFRFFSFSVFFVFLTLAPLFLCGYFSYLVGAALIVASSLLSGWCWNNIFVLSVTFILLTLIPLFLFFGLFGNWLYARHINKKIDKGYHLCVLKNIDPISFWLCSFIPFLGMVSALRASISDKSHVLKTLSSQIFQEKQNN